MFIPNELSNSSTYVEAKVTIKWHKNENDRQTVVTKP